MTPHHLHALAAAWSLQAARRTLTDLAREEAARNTNTLLDAAPILRAPVYGTRLSGGSHGDPVGDLLTAERRPVRVTTWADLRATADKRLGGIAAMLRIDGPNLARIIELTPRVLPGTAAVLARHLADEDRWVRDAIGVGCERRHLVDIECPACAERALYVQTAGPQDAWTIVCDGSRRDGRHNPCLCTGQGCRCGMDGAVEGVAHIWPRNVVLAGVPR